MAKNNKTTARNIGIGAGVAAAAAAAAAGYYFYASDEAAKNRRLAAKWARDMKNEVVVQAKKVGDIDRKQMLAIIDRAASAYETARAVDPKELTKATKELRDNWQVLIAELKSRTSGARKALKARSVPKKAAKPARAKASVKKRAAR